MHDCLEISSGIESPTTKSGAAGVMDEASVPLRSRAHNVVVVLGMLLLIVRVRDGVNDTTTDTKARKKKSCSMGIAVNVTTVALEIVTMRRTIYSNRNNRRNKKQQASKQKQARSFGALSAV
jgi:hypothetical protein